MTIAIFGETGLIGRAIKHEFKDEFMPLKLKNWVDKEIELAWEKIESVAHDKEFALDLVWAAGRSNNSSDIQVINRELELVDTFLGCVYASKVKIKSINLISSAGSIYAGSMGEIITKESPPNPISRYGYSRLEIEEKFFELAVNRNILLNVFRLTNVFGKRNTLKPSSGLISHLINANLTRKEINIFVPLFVQQDYIDVNFVAKNIYQNIKINPSNMFNTYIYSRNQSHSILELISLVDTFMGRKTPYITHKIETSIYRQNNLHFNIDYDDKNMVPIEPINITVKRLVSEMVHEKIL
jgi:nucleoside-diphosphate-sugar epimerase